MKRYHLDRRIGAILSQNKEWSDDRVIDTEELGCWLGVAPHWCEVRRWEGTGPAYFNLSPKRVRYRVGEVRAWLHGRAEARLDLQFGERADLPAESRP